MSGTTQGKDHPPLAGFQDVNYTFKMKRKLMLSFSLCARMIGTSSGEAAPAPRLSAAQLQAAHLQALEKAALVDPTIDPFPPMTISNGAGAVNDAQQDLDMKDPYPPTSTSSSALAGSTSKVAAPTPKPINISDESAFPSLSGAGSGTKAGPTWGAGGGAAAMRIKQQLSSAVPSSAASSANGISRVGTPLSEDLNGKSIGSIFTASVQLAQNEIHIQKPAFSGRPQGSSREAEPTTLGEVMKLLMKRHPTVTVEASTSRQITTFILKGKGANAEEEVAAVRRELMGRLAKKITLELPVPAGMRAFIIGVKGRTLKQITDESGAQVQVPPREADESTSEAADSSSPDGPLIALSITGDSSAVALARAKILAIVSERASKVNIKLEDVPRQFWALLSGVKGAKMAALVEGAQATGLVTVHVPRAYERKGLSANESEEEEKREADKVITIQGDREAASRVVQAIENEVAELKRTSKTLSVSINKRQHRFLVGQNADDILEASGCSVELSPMEDPSDQVTIRGPSASLANALQMVMAKSEATPLDTLDLSTAHKGTHDKLAYASYLTRYVVRKAKFRQLAETHDVQVYLPRNAAIAAGQPIIEIVGKEGGAEGMAGARKDIISIVRALPPSHFAIVEVDSLIHRHLIGKKGSKIKAFEEKNGVELVFPNDGEDRPDILLVFTGQGAPEVVLAEVSAEILKLAKEAADITTVTLTIPQPLHRSIIGQGGTTLNAVIGEERLVNVSFGSKPRAAGDAKPNGNETAGADDLVVIRGPSEEVARVSKEISRIAEEAKNSEIVNSFVAEFEIDTLLVRHVVGKAGAGVNKIRDDLGVRIDFEELGATGKGTPKSKVTLKGRKENVEEAKKRILSVTDKIADEVTLTITLPSTLERGSLIGKQGTYLKRLETNYDVRINFPKDSRKDQSDASEQKGNPNEITIKGGKQGATAAKKELVDLIEYEKENGNVVVFTVSTKSLPRILGKAGAQINQIKEETLVTVDVDQADDAAPTSTITLRGTKAGTASAKSMILAIAKEVDDEARFTLEIPRAFHTTLIGSGGSNIRDLIANAGGPADPRSSGNTVRFPRQGDDADTVIITAPKAIAERVLAALKKEVAALQSRVVWGVVVPHTLHASVIGKGASALQELQRTYGVKVLMPGWNDYPTAGDVINLEDVKDAPAGDIVKIIGPREAAISAAADISKGRAGQVSVIETVQVPRKLHARVAQGGRFFRSLPQGTRVSHDGAKPPSTKSRKLPQPNGSSPAAPSARIDDDASAPTGAAEEQMTFEIVSNSDGDEDDDSEIPWVVESTSQEEADKTVAEIKKALAAAASATHVGWLTVPRSLMPRIVGRGGSGLDKLRANGVEVDVVGRRDSNTLTLVGTPDAINQAYQSIVELAAPRPPRQQRDRDQDY